MVPPGVRRAKRIEPCQCASATSRTPGPGSHSRSGPCFFRPGSPASRPGARVGAVPNGPSISSHDSDLYDAAADSLSDAFATAVRGSAPRVLVDCEGLDFCDSTGLNVLLRARLAATEAGIAVELTGLHAAVARLFEITGADGVFRTYPTL